jgi:hypothetical protein
MVDIRARRNASDVLKISSLKGAFGLPNLTSFRTDPLCTQHIQFRECPVFSYTAPEVCEASVLNGVHAQLLPSAQDCRIAASVISVDS